LWTFAEIGLATKMLINHTKIPSTMNLYSQIKKAWQKKTPEWKVAHRARLIKWRTEPVTVRIANPTRLDRARALGYKSKEGFVIVRQRIDRGGRKRPTIRNARNSTHSGQTKNLSKNYQQIAEERANRRFPNLEVLNSFPVGKDGKRYWFEVILIDKENAAVKADKDVSWVARPANRRRAFRGLTSAARKGRGLRNKGIGSERIRPSLRSNERRK
jgi:large subunit ribosomal protein L15e